MSDRRQKLAGFLDIVVILTGYTLAVFSILSNDALLAFTWGQLALFWYLRVYNRQKKSESTEKPQS